VVDGETGFLVKDVAEMASAIGRVDAIDPWRCRALVEERFSAGALATGYLAIYEKILCAEKLAMTAYAPKPSRKWPEAFQILGLDSVRVTVVGREIVLEGNVESYELKCKAGESVRQDGFSIQNCLRIVPGIASL